MIEDEIKTELERALDLLAQDEEHPRDKANKLTEIIRHANCLAQLWANAENFERLPQQERQL